MNGESDYLKEKTSLDISSTDGIPSKGTKGRFCKLMQEKNGNFYERTPFC